MRGGRFHGRPWCEPPGEQLAARGRRLRRAGRPPPPPPYARRPSPPREDDRARAGLGLGSAGLRRRHRGGSLHPVERRRDRPRARGLRSAIATFDRIAAEAEPGSSEVPPGPIANAALTASLIARAALRRTESRGGPLPLRPPANAPVVADSHRPGARPAGPPVPPVRRQGLRPKGGRPTDGPLALG